jgi:tripartite-type tricarboxylate transporter receptor subunit TctC
MVSKRRPFDGVSDFSAITQLTASHNVLVVGPSFTGKTLADLVAQARANPGRIDYASSGVGSMQHLAGEMLARMASIQITHVPYKGGPPAFTDMAISRPMRVKVLDILSQRANLRALRYSKALPMVEDSDQRGENRR